MDFGLDDIIQQTLSKKAPPENEKKRKWVSVEDKEKQRLQARKQQEDIEKAAKKRKIEEKPKQETEKEEIKKSNNEKAQTKAQNDDKIFFLNLPLGEIFKLLRELHQPITLFGESHQDRVDRLKTHLEMADEFTHKAGSNDLQALLRQHEHSMNNIISSSSTNEESTTNDPKKIEENKTSDPTNPDQNPSASTLSSSTSSDASKEDKSKSIRKIDPLNYSTPSGDVVPLLDNTGEFGLPAQKPHYSSEKSVRVVLKFLLEEWDTYLMNRPVQILKSNSGKHDIGICKQTRLYLEPLFKLLKHKKVPPDVLESLFRIVNYLRNREYVKANDVYMELSIGNSPWPIGVTMVGIHARSARERIENSKIAHVLNDEETRKYIQSVKRLITFCQKRFPDPDSSKMFYGQ